MKNNKKIKAKEKTSKENTGIMPNSDLIRKHDKEIVDRMLNAMERSKCETTK